MNTKFHRQIFVLALILLGFFSFIYEAEANDPPQWQQVPNQAVFVNSKLEFKVYAYDPDLDGVTYSVVNPPSNSTFDQKQHVFSWAPHSGQTGNWTITFRAYDGVNSADMGVLVVVTGVNNPSPGVITQSGIPPVPGTIPPQGPPVFLTFNPPTTAKEGQLYTYTAQASYTNNIAPIYRLIGAPQGMTISPQFGIIAWVPNFSQGSAVPYQVVVGASNGYFEATKTYTVLVEDATPPTVTSGSAVAYTPAPVSSAQISKPAPKIVISELSYAFDGEDVIVTWKTDKPARGRVIYDTVSEAEKTKDFTYANATEDLEEDELFTEHSVKLAGLEPETKYYFRAVAKTDNIVSVSDEESFTSPAKRGLGLALLSDFADFFGAHWVFSVIVGAFLGFLAFRAFRRKPAAE